MKVTVLASGSKGNVTFVEDEDTRVLIDVGMRSCYIEEKLKEKNIDPNSINAILLTHTHKDHIMGVHTFSNRYKIPVYISKKMEKELDITKKTFITKEMNVGNINVKVIRTSHDIESFGYILNDKLVYITDTGYINEKYFEMLRNKKIYIMESNHDIEMLEEGPYPYYLKQRIWSDKGHLSNEASSEYLSKLIGKDTNCVILAHLSETNNKEEIAIKEFKKRNKVSKLIVAKPKEATELVEV